MSSHARAELCPSPALRLDRIGPVRDAESLLCEVEMPLREPSTLPDSPVLLVVDGDCGFRTYLAELLAGQAFAVMQAANGEEAIALLDSGGIDLLVTDLVMEGTDGFELLTTVRARHPELPVIAMTGSGRVDAATYLRIASELGARVTLEKPFRPGDLLDAVCAIVGGARRQDESDLG